MGTTSWIKNKAWSLISKKKISKESSSLFLSYEGDITKEIIALFDGKSNPFRNFTAQEIISATDNFRKGEYKLVLDTVYHGCIEGRSILVGMMKFTPSPFGPAFTRHIAVSSQLSHHKNALKLLGYCLEFKKLVAVYEDPGGLKSISDLLFRSDNIKTALPWSSRLRIANDIANFLVYLHTAFPTPLIHCNMMPQYILIDQFGTTKLCDFSWCLLLPPGKSEICTAKFDVHSFGLVLLNLLTGCSTLDLLNRENANFADFLWLMKERMSEQDGLNKIVDPSLLVDGAELEKKEQVRALFNLAIKCTEDEPADRTEMIDMAKELKRIEKIRI